MPAPKRLHEIFVYEKSPAWLRAHDTSMFRPQVSIPSFEEFISGERALEWSEYEDLLFMAVLGHFLSQIPKFGGPKLIELTRQISQRARLFPDLLNLLREQNMVLPCDHLVGVSLDKEDVPDINAWTTEAAQRAERVAAIFNEDMSTLPKTEIVAAKLTDEEVVDIYLYSILESENVVNLPRPTWAIEQAERAMKHVDDLWNEGRPDGQPAPSQPDNYVPRESGVPEPVEYVFMILTQKSTGKNAELVRFNLTEFTNEMRVAGKWGEFIRDDYWNENYDFHAVSATPQHRTHLIEIFDSQQHIDTDLSEFFIVPGQPRKVAKLTEKDLEDYLNAEVLFTDVNGIQCSTARVGQQKQVWPSFGQALGPGIGEVWVFRADVLLPQASGQSDDDVTLQFFADEMTAFGLEPRQAHVTSPAGKAVPAILVPVPRQKVSKDLATDIALSAIMTGRLGIYQFVDMQMTVFTSSAVGYTRKRSFQIVMA